jgi:ABC-type polysaccharide transport system permease subunit
LKNKQHWVAVAETIDRLRIFPRIFLLACFGWAVWIADILLAWYMALPPTSQQWQASGFASVVFVAVMTFLKMVYQTYSDAGPVWGAQPSSTTTASTTVTKVENPGAP